MITEPKQLNLQRSRVFLSYAKEDRSKVRTIHRKLVRERLNPWLDLNDLLPGQDWDQTILHAIRNARFVIVFLSKNSVSKRGYVQKEIEEALDLAERMPEGEIFIIPVKLEVCDLPTRLSKWQCIDVYRPGGLSRIIKAIRANLNADDIKAESKSRKTVLPTSAEIAESILLKTIPFGGVFLTAKLGTNQYAFSNGHFLVLTKRIPSNFRNMSREYPSHIKLTPELISKMLGPKKAYRRAANLVREIRMPPTEVSVYVLVSKGNKRSAIYRPYMQYIQMNYPSGKIYFSDSKRPIVVEEENEVRFLVMPMRVDDKTLSST